MVGNGPFLIADSFAWLGVPLLIGGLYVLRDVRRKQEQVYECREFREYKRLQETGDAVLPGSTEESSGY